MNSSVLSIDGKRSGVFHTGMMMAVIGHLRLIFVEHREVNIGIQIKTYYCSVFGCMSGSGFEDARQGGLLPFVLHRDVFFRDMLRTKRSEAEAEIDVQLIRVFPKGCRLRILPIASHVIWR